MRIHKLSTFGVATSKLLRETLYNFWRFGVGFAVSLDLIAFRRSLKRAARMCSMRARVSVCVKSAFPCVFLCLLRWLINQYSGMRKAHTEAAHSYYRREQYTRYEICASHPRRISCCSDVVNESIQKGLPLSILIIENSCAPPSMQQ